MSGAKVDMDVDRSHYYPAMNPFVAGFFYPDSKKGDALITPSSRLFFRPRVASQRRERDQNGKPLHSNRPPLYSSSSSVGITSMQSGVISVWHRLMISISSRRISLMRSLWLCPPSKETTVTPPVR